ncbi:Clavaminate synthase-like protein [Massarina eburnea CBS 473.64]|uniref:Clavaminate synthase-like protein n=1 Tax=Massarina eburnea CBS 473.64 TaxID=1395130 RepID=A0A6A6S5S0_9PLEO|nr:Clavaminate synthase-like protein [Massarina eburnea CBS 473.64]
MAFSNPAPFPAFPSDIQVLPTETLSLSKLLANDEEENARLFDACSSNGLFLLDLSQTEEGSNTWGPRCSISCLPERFSAAGTGRIDAKGTPDRCEFCCLCKNDILGLTPPLPAPELVNKNRDTYAPFIKRCHGVSMLILQRLESTLGLPVGALQGLHRIDQISSDQTLQIKYSPQPEGDRRTSLVPYTDYGSITILFNVLAGLQVFPHDESVEEKNWRWLKLVPNCAVVNLGDAMVKFTNGLFKSPMHRVTYAPGEQSLLTRYSLAYFTRPEDKCVMRRIQGSAMIPELGKGEVEEDVMAGD